MVEISDDGKIVIRNKIVIQEARPDLGYYSGLDKIPKDVIKISPSGLSGFFNDSAEWYNKNIRKSEKFDGNTSTVLGSVVHYCAECHELGLEPDNASINEYIASYIGNDDIDMTVVKEEYWDMFIALRDEYLINPSTPTAIGLEQFLFNPLIDGFAVGGSVDRLEPRTVVDYKTAKVKPQNMKMHRLQLLTYAWLYTKQGTPIDTIKTVVVQRKTKTLPPRVWVMEQMVTDEDMEYIEDMMKILARSVSVAKADASMIDLLFRENPVAMFAATEQVDVKRAKDIQSAF